MNGQYCKNYDVKREKIEGDMMSFESHQVFKKLLLFLTFIKMIGLIHLFCHIANRLTALRFGISEYLFYFILLALPTHKNKCINKDINDAN